MPGDVPAWLVATRPEWAVYWALQRLGKRPGIDFDFQSSLQGGRIERGGMVLDFILFDPQNVAINVQGEYWHYQQGSERIARDKIQRASSASMGFTLVYIDESDAIANPLYYTSEALKGIDHSRMQEM
jgi:hypothetical protein